MTKLTILITGATAGIGRRLATDLLALGHRVIATGRRAEALESLRQEHGDKDLLALAMDVTDEGSIAAAKAAIDRATSGRGVDVLINNAGYGQLGPVEMISGADVEKQYRTNVFGLLAVTRAFVPAMRARGAGRVINISSVGGLVTVPLMGVYNSTKFAVESLSDALRVELRPFGVDVVLIEPGYIRTEFTDTSVEHLAAYRDERSPYAPVMARFEELERLMGRTAVGPEHVTRAVVRAVHARRPRARYVAPWTGALMSFLAAISPTRAVDFVFARLIGLTKKRLAPARRLELGA